MTLEDLKETFDTNIIMFENIKCDLVNNTDEQLNKLKSSKKITGVVSFDKFIDEFQIISDNDIYIRFKVSNQKNLNRLAENIKDEMYNLSNLELSIDLNQGGNEDIYLTSYFFNLKHQCLLELEKLKINDEKINDEKINMNDYTIYPEAYDENKNDKKINNNINIVKEHYFLYTIRYISNKPSFILLGKNKSILINIKTKLNEFSIEEEHIEYESIFNEQLIVNNNNIFIGYFKSKSTTLPNDVIKNNIVAIKTTLSRENSDYLEVWGEYISREGNALLDHARKVGVINSNDISYSHQDSMYIVSIIPNEYQKLNYLKIGDSLSVIKSSEDVPYINNEKMNWENYNSNNSNKDNNFNKDNKNKKDKGYLIEKIQNSLIYLKTDNDKLKISSAKNKDDKDDKENNKNKLKFILNIQGSESQIKRREEAKDIILSRANPMDNLYELLEGKISTTISHKNQINKSDLRLTTYVKEKIFNNNEPTSTQLEAIKIAINTPDIAVIQGPPGTGKTTVITAILEALNENYDKTEATAGNILITSFQHDAVENIIQKLTINALPTIKFGKRSNDDNDGFNMDKFIKNWGNDLIKSVKNKNINVKFIEEIQKLKEIIETYKNSPTLENQNKFLYYSKDLILNISSNQELLDLIDYIIEYSNQDLNTNLSQSLVKQVLNLRITKESFKDDGAVNAFKLYYTLKDDTFKNIDEKKFILNELHRAYNNYKNIDIISDDNEDFNLMLKKLEQIRGYLLKKLKPKSLYMPPQINPDILNLYNMIERELKLLEKNPKDLIIYEYIESLENNTNLINNALKEYTTVFGATIQQTLSTNILDIKVPKVIIDYKNKKSIIKSTMKPKYDTVIIDETARANPGDLMIALMQAKNKIIIVGDHRQLPHMYEESILDEIVNDNEHKQSITQSLFERLILIVKKLEQKDGNKRFITLNTQYRMPKILGDFVSDNFYKQHKEDFNSPLENENFKEYLNLMPSFANWIDVPYYKNLETSEKKVGGSYNRIQEIDVILTKLKELIQTELGKDLTYGIISFYKSQVIEIKKRLPEELRTKVRVGSVDAFQGLEFDVIFLSTVRTSESLDLYNDSKKDLEENNENNENNEIIEYNKTLDNLKKEHSRKTFGFLSVENRLCVAMSRQKKILIAVGDLELFKSELGQEFVPAMYNFYKLCKETDGIIF